VTTNECSTNPLDNFWAKNVGQYCSVCAGLAAMFPGRGEREPALAWNLPQMQANAENPC
jgi:hypothetical protein